MSRRLRNLWPADPAARALTLTTLAMSVGTGILMTVSAVLLVRGAGLDPATVGYGLTAAGAVGVAASYGAGRLADRCGARRLLVVALAGAGIAEAGYAAIGGITAFLLVAGGLAATQQGAFSARQAFVAAAFTGPARVEVRARLRVATNLAVGVGTGMGAVALAVGTGAAWRAVVVLAGGATLLAAVAAARLPADRPRSTPAERAARSPLRDRTYLTATALTSVMSLQMGLFSVGVPLWVTTATAAPTTTIAAAVAVNAGLVVLLQVRCARGTDDVGVAGRVVRRGGVALGVACAGYAAAATGDGPTAVALVLAAAVAHTAGELWTEAGRWGLAFELADPHSPGAYQGVGQAGIALAAMAAPAVVTATAIEHGTAGWAALALVFVATGAATHRLTRSLPSGHPAGART